MNGYFAHTSTEYEAFDTYKIANIEQFLEDRIVHFGLLGSIYIFAGDIDLDTSLRVLQLHKRRLAHNATAHNTPGHTDLSFGFEVVVEIGSYIYRKSIGRI